MVEDKIPLISSSNKKTKRRRVDQFVAHGHKQAMLLDGISRLDQLKDTKIVTDGWSGLTTLANAMPQSPSPIKMPVPTMDSTALKIHKLLGF
jgi:hypothetical protein